MPDRAALITVLIVGRPLCFDCIAARANLAVPDVEQYIDVIRQTVKVFREAHDRCRACGRSAKVVSVDPEPL